MLALVLAFTVVTDYGGRLVASDAIVTPHSVTVPLRYVNDTPTARTVRLRCTLLTRRGDVVATESSRLDAVPAGESRELRMRIVDTAQAADRAECTIERHSVP